MITTIYLVRHGQSINNTKSIVQGAKFDSGNVLSPLGISQAKEIAKHFENLRIDRICSSPMIRARMTADFIAIPHKLKVELLDGLREKIQGSMEGLTTDELLAKYGEWSAMSEDERLDIKVVPDEESQRELRVRTINTITQLVSQNVGRTIVCVTHAGFMRSVYSYLHNVSLSDHAKFANCGFMKLEVEGNNINTTEVEKLTIRNSY